MQPRFYEMFSHDTKIVEDSNPNSHRDRLHGGGLASFGRETDS